MNSDQRSKPITLLNPKITLVTTISVICLVVIFLIFFFALIQNLNTPQDSFDEGWRLMAAKLIGLGYEPYAEVYHVDPPLYPIVTGFAARIASYLRNDWINSPVPARAVSVLLAISGAFFLYIVGKILYGPLSGVIAAFILLLTPVFFELARRALPEIGAVTLGILSVALILIYRRRGSYVWLFLGGMTFGSSLLFKLIFPLLIFLLIALLSRPAPSPDNGFTLRLPSTTVYLNIKGLLWFGVGAILPLLLLLLLLDTKAVYEQAWAFHIVSRYVGVPDKPLGIFYEVMDRFFRRNTVLILVGLAAIIFAGVRRSWIPVAWLGLGLVNLILQVPMRYRYTIILIPPLALLVGLLVQTTLDKLRQPDARSRIAAIGGLLLMVFYLFTIPSIWQTNIQTTNPDEEFAQTIDDLNARLNETIPDTSFIISDEPVLIFSIHKLVPPHITELSKKRVLAGFLDAYALDQLIADYPDAPILTRTGLSRIDRIPGFEQWIMANFLDRADIESRVRNFTLYYTPVFDHQCTTHQDTSPATRQGWVYRCVQTTANDQIRLNAVRFKPGSIQAGDSISVVLSLSVLSRNLDTSNTKVLIHLLDEQGQIVAQADHIIFHNELELAPLNALLADQNILPTPSDLTAGKYEIVVGFYRADTGERLTLSSNIAKNNALPIGAVTVR